MATVIVKESTYEYNKLRDDSFEILTTLDNGLIKPGSNILIKPNLLNASTEEQAVTTHSLLIKAVAEYVISKGGNPIVADSPPLGSFEKIVKKTGLKSALKGMPVTLKELSDSKRISVEGRWNHIDLAGEALEADVIINLPKLKTHVQMVMTLAVKNLFGCIIGLRKPEWHYRIGENKDIFAELLLTVYRTLKPQINLIDGILSMEGLGPGVGGTPRHLGLLLGSDNAVALDDAVCKSLQIRPDTVPTIKKAMDLGLLEEYEILGELPNINDFRTPDLREMLLGPTYVHRFIRRQLTNRPICIDETCKLCRECKNICPANVISESDSKEKRLEFDYDRCIRCYCCLEICPHGAMEMHEPLIKRALTKTISIFRRLR